MERPIKEEYTCVSIGLNVYSKMQDKYIDYLESKLNTIAETIHNEIAFKVNKKQ